MRDQVNQRRTELGNNIEQARRQYPNRNQRAVGPNLSALLGGAIPQEEEKTSLEESKENNVRDDSISRILQEHGLMNGSSGEQAERDGPQLRPFPTNIPLIPEVEPGNLSDQELV